MRVARRVRVGALGSLGGMPSLRGALGSGAGGRSQWQDTGRPGVAGQGLLTGGEEPRGAGSSWEARKDKLHFELLPGAP